MLQFTRATLTRPHSPSRSVAAPAEPPPSAAGARCRPGSARGLAGSRRAVTASAHCGRTLPRTRLGRAVTSRSRASGAKPGSLSQLELIKMHSQASHDILSPITFPWPVAEVALQRHERLDGSGYAQGLTADAIIVEARIVAVADVVEAMSSHRPYRPVLGMEAALDEIRAGAGRRYDVEWWAPVCASSSKASSSVPSAEAARLRRLLRGAVGARAERTQGAPPPPPGGRSRGRGNTG
jgi:HD domain